MTKQALSLLSILLIFLFHSITTLAQPAAVPSPPVVAPAQPTTPPTAPAKPPAPAATPPTQPANAPVQSAQVPIQKGPTDIIKILTKAHGYSVFIRLLKSTGVAGQLFGQLNNSNIGFTIFAPVDSAFSNLKAGTINSLSDLQKTELIQFHILNTVVALSNFQTLSNPVPTEAGDTSDGEFPLNVTTAGNQVNISTGLVNTTLGGTIYLDNQLAIYQVDKVLLPLDIFSPKPKVAAAPTLSKPDATTTATNSPSGDVAVAAKVDASGAMRLGINGMLLSIGVAVATFFARKGP
ncbi:hypothetical protein F2P56_032733 [Juglans regia]|uniref:Fasciclin-like arabinogalactan protein 12 n=2 Tax=Juglans regia TaxID=51240 RepID=A0A2I4EJ95_JUGRE|nr:fasciclin-like arabinogalactan protein 12 [Juglans regia]KAF5447163.1 hypothetical protein F2P56_032733 [Juglans regia]